MVGTFMLRSRATADRNRANVATSVEVRVDAEVRALGRNDTGALAATTASLSLQVATALRVRVLVDVFTPVTLRAEAPTVMARGLAVDTAVGLPLTSTVRNPLTSL